MLTALGVADLQRFQQFAKQQLGRGVFQCAESGQRINTECPLVPGCLGQCGGSGVVVEISQRGGCVETNLEFTVFQGGLEERYRLGPDRLQRKSRFSGRLDRFELPGELLHSDLPGHVVLADLDLADHAQESREVVTVLGMYLQHDRAVGLGVGQRFTDPVAVVRVEPFADPVGNTSCHADTAVPVLQGDHEVTIFPRETSTGDSAAAENAGEILAVAFPMGDQDVALGPGKNVSGQYAFAWHDGPLGKVGFHQPAPVEAGGLAARR